MGGGGAMRTAGKVAGIGVFNGGLRGLPAVPPAEQQVSAAARKATRPVSAIVSSSNVQASDVMGPVQRPSWEIDDWEFAGGEEELILGSRDPMPRVVFGGAPTMNEAKAATSELKDALEKVYLKSPDSTECGGSFTVGQGASLPLLSNSEYLETKTCVTSETKAIPSVPKQALQAFMFFCETPAAQTTVASIACDPNVLNAVMQNEAFLDFMQSHMTGASSHNIDLNVKESVVDGDFQDQESPKNSEESSGTGFMGYLQNIKHTVVDFVSDMSGYIQSIFGGSSADNKSVDSDASDGATFMDRTTLGASFMALAMMVIMVVVFKRG